MKNNNKTATASDIAVINIPVGQIEPDPKNRKDHDKNELARLAESIRVDGLLQPVTVRPIEAGKDGKYSRWMLVAGERRWLAHKLLKLDTIAALSVAGKDGAAPPDLDLTRKRAAENLHRQNLTPVEEAEVYRQLLDTGMTQADVARFVGISQPAVANQLRLLKHPAGVRALLQDGTLSRAHGVALARFAQWPKVVEVMAECTIEDEWSAKSLERDELPFSYNLERKGLVFELSEWRGYTATDEMKKSPHWLVCRGGFYCFDKAVFEAEKKRQDAVIAEKKAESAKAGGKSAAGGLNDEEKARRQKVREERARQREETTAQLAAAMQKIKAGEDDAVIKVLLHEAFGFEFVPRLNGAAENLGVKLTRAIATGANGGVVEPELLVSEMGLDAATRLVAAAIVKRKGEAAIRDGFMTPEVITFVAGKYKKPPPAPAPAKKDEDTATVLAGGNRHGKTALAQAAASRCVGKLDKALAGSLAGMFAKGPKQKAAKKGAKKPGK